jgi:hypothetical protein
MAGVIQLCQLRLQCSDDLPIRGARKKEIAAKEISMVIHEVQPKEQKTNIIFLKTGLPGADDISEVQRQACS